MTSHMGNYLITGGAGYIGSLLTGYLLWRGHRVTVVDDLMFGGESLIGYWRHPKFEFVKGDITRTRTIQSLFSGSNRYDAVVHLAAIVGFPACQSVGRQVAWRFNVSATERLFEEAALSGVDRFVLASTYSNYGLSPDGEPVDENSSLFPQSLYAETKIAAEEILLKKGMNAACSPVVLRFSTLFGISPRTRFDLIINQFVLEALTKRKLIIYQRGYARSFVHVRDVCEAVSLALSASLDRVRGQVFNVGGDVGNFTKDEIVAMIRDEVDGMQVEYKDLSFGGDMRDIRVSFSKIRAVLGFEPAIEVREGIREIKTALADGLIRNPHDERYRNAQFIVQ